MMKMQLYVFTQIIDLIEADQVRRRIFNTIFSFDCLIIVMLDAGQL